MDFIQASLAALRRTWLDCNNRKLIKQHYAIYLHQLHKIEEFIIELGEVSQEIEEVIPKEHLAQVVTIALEHTMTGTLPWLIVMTWLQLLEKLLKRVEGSILSTDLVPRLWSSIALHSRDNSGAAATALCAELRILTLVLKYAPVSMKGALRKHLPHPLKHRAIATRVCGFKCMPWIVANLPSSLLTQEFFEYIRKGLISDVWPVQEAAMEAVRTIMELGVFIEPSMQRQLIGLLVATCNGAAFASLKSQEDAGMALGYLLVLSQSGYTHGKMSVTVASEQELSWTYLAGCSREQAHDVTRCLFHNPMSRAMQQVLAIAISVLFHIGCKSATLSEALRSAFVLLIPVPGDSRTYMPRLLANALRDWALRLPTDAHRLSLVNSVCKYVHNINEVKSVVRTALIALDAIIPLLASPREMFLEIEQDLLLALKAYPSLLDPVSNVLGVMGSQIHDSFYQYNLLYNFVRASHSISNAEDVELPRDFVLWTKAILVALQKSRSNGKAPSLMIGPILTVIIQLSYCKTVDGCAGDAIFQRTELFFMLVKALLECYHDYISSSVRGQVELAVKQFLLLLVNTPVKSSAYYHAACATCRLLGSSNYSQTLTDMQRMLCIGLLEGQLVAVSTFPGKTENNLSNFSQLFEKDIQKLKAEVYQVIVKSPWQLCPDEGSLRWLVTQALNDLEKACEDNVPVLLEDKALFPLPAVSLLKSSRCILPLASDLNYAKGIERAVGLVGWGFHHFASIGTTEGRDFCIEISTRLQAITAMRLQGNILATELPASPRNEPQSGNNAVDTTTITVWNLLTCWAVIFDTSLSVYVGSSFSTPLCSSWWKHFVPSLQQLENIIDIWTSSSLFDLKLLACKVLGCIWCLLDETSSVTTTMVEKGSPSAENILSIVEAHRYSAFMGRSLATLPMVISFASESTKRHSLPSDPCSLAELTLLTAFIRLAEFCAMESAEQLLGVLISCFLAPTAPSIDPLVLSLSLMLIELFFPVVDVCVQKDGSDFIAACVKDAATWRRPPYQRDEAEDGAHICSIGRMLPYCRGSDSHSKLPQVNLCVMISDRFRELLDNSSFFSSNGTSSRKTSSLDGGIDTQRTVVLRHLPDLFLRRMAEFFAHYHAEIFIASIHTPMRLLEVGRLVDASSTKETRRAWFRVGRIILQHEIATAGSRRTSVYLKILGEMRKLLLARSPDLGASSSHSSTEILLLRSHDDYGMKMSESEDYEGQRSFLTSNAIKRRSGREVQDTSSAVPQECAEVFSDLPAKEFALCALDYLLPLLTSATPEVHYAYLHLVAMSGALVENFPDLMGCVTDLLLDILTHYSASSDNDAKDSMSQLIDHKVPLLSCVKTLVRLSVFQVAKGCALARVFMNSKLANDGDMQRIVESLFLLLNTLDRLSNGDSASDMESSQRAERAADGGLIIPGQSAGIVAVELARVVEYAEACGWADTAYKATCTLRSAAGQGALYLLCSHFVSLMSMLNGYQPPATLVYPGPTDVNIQLVGLDAVLTAVACVAEGTDKGVHGLGPGLRYAVGCLCCTLIVTKDKHLRTIARLCGKLLSLHQDILAHVVYNTLMCRSPQTVFESDFPLLLCIFAKTTGVPKTSTIAKKLLAYCEKRYSFMVPHLPIPVTESLLLIFFSVRDNYSVALASVSNLLRWLPVDCLLLSSSFSLIEAALEFCSALFNNSFLVSQTEGVLEKLGRSGTSGLLLSDLLCLHHTQQRLMTSVHEPRWHSMLEANELCPYVAQLLVEAYSETSDPLALTASLISSTTSSVKAVNIVAAIASVKSEDIFIKCHSSLCSIFEFLLHEVSTTDDTASNQESVIVAIHVLATLLTNEPHQHIARYALRPIGVKLVEQVAKSNPVEFRLAIHAMEREKLMAVRRFMEACMI